MQPVAFDIDAIRPGSEMNFDTLPGNAIGMFFFSIHYYSKPCDKKTLFNFMATLSKY